MIYILHIDPPLAHAKHYVGWTSDTDVSRRVRAHLEQKGRHPSKLIRAALLAGRTVTLAASFEGDRTLEHMIKRGGNTARYCPRCRDEHHRKTAERRRVKKEGKALAPAPVEGV